MYIDKMKAQVESLIQDASIRTRSTFGKLRDQQRPASRKARNVQEESNRSPPALHSIMAKPKSISFKLIERAMSSEMAFRNLTILANANPQFSSAWENQRIRRQIAEIVMQNCVDLNEVDISCNEEFAKLKSHLPEFDGSRHSTFDGTCNNLRAKTAGATPIPLKRFLPAAYDSLPSTPRQTSKLGGLLPSTRDISNAIGSGIQVGSGIFTMLGITWGQFLDHDIDLTCAGNFDLGMSCANVCRNQQGSECFPILINSSDPDLSCRECIPFTRSCPACVKPCSDINEPGPREQINQITSYIDAGLVYGGPDSNEEQYWMNLYNQTTGKLRVQRSHFDTDLLPDADKGFDKCNSGCFVAGDSRANEATVLTVLHTIFLREHNRLVTGLSQINPTWEPTKLYLEARRIVAAELQHITYEEFVPLMLGSKLPTRSYDNKYTASTSNVFATASFRFGHGTLTEDFLRLDSDYKNSTPALPMHQGFFDTSHLRQPSEDGGLDSFIRGMAVQEAFKNDRKFSDSVRNRLFENQNHDCGLDLLALNTQRGRDHGLPSYNKWRQFVKTQCGRTTGRVQTFDDLKDDIPTDALDKLKSIYKHVDDIDLFPGAMSEKLFRNAATGPTFACINKLQFTLYRKADRFWYTNPGIFTEEQRKELRSVTLAKILCDNGDNIERIPRNVMQFKSASPNLVNCSDIPAAGIDLTKWGPVMNSMTG